MTVLLRLLLMFHLHKISDTSFIRSYIMRKYMGMVFGWTTWFSSIWSKLLHSTLIFRRRCITIKLLAIKGNKLGKYYVALYQEYCCSLQFHYEGSNWFTTTVWLINLIKGATLVARRHYKIRIRIKQTRLHGWLGGGIRC